MLASIGMSKKVMGVAQEAVSAEAVQHWAQFAEEFDAACVALRVNVAMDVVVVNGGMDLLELFNHLVDATREQCQLNVVD